MSLTIDKKADLHIQQVNNLHCEIRDNLNHCKRLQSTMFIMTGTILGWASQVPTKVPDNSTTNSSPIFNDLDLFIVASLCVVAMSIVTGIRDFINKFNILVMSTYIEEVEQAFANPNLLKFLQGWEESKERIKKDVDKQSIWKHLGITYYLAYFATFLLLVGLVIYFY